MVIFRVSFDSLRRQAREENTYFYRTPRGLNYERLKENKVLGNFRLVSEKPIVINYGNTSYAITRDYVEIDIDEREFADIEMRDIFISSRIGIVLGTFGMLNVKDILATVRRHKWIGGRLTPVDRKVMDTDAFGRPFKLELMIEISEQRILRYVLRYNRKLTKNELIRNMSRIANIETRRVAQKIESMIAGKLIEVVRIQVYLDVSDEVIMLLIPEGLPYTRMIKEVMRRFGWTRRRSVDAWFLAYEKDYIKESKRRLYLTREGREVLSRYIKRERVKLEDRIAITKKGIDRIFK